MLMLLGWYSSGKTPTTMIWLRNSVFTLALKEKGVHNTYTLSIQINITDLVVSTCQLEREISLRILSMFMIPCIHGLPERERVSHDQEW